MAARRRVNKRESPAALPPRNLRTLTIAQVMARTNWRRDRVYRLINRGELAFVRTETRGSFLVMEFSLEQWFRTQLDAPLPRTPERSVVDADIELDREMPIEGRRIFS